MIGVTVTVDVDGEQVVGHFDFESEPDALDLAACREVLAAVYRKSRA